MVMLLVMSLFQWWYGDGFRGRIKLASVRLEGMIDYFSFSLLLKTLFSPYRQISAGKVDGPLEVKMRAFVDKLFSRVIGAVIRLIIMIIGLIAITVLIFYTLVSLIIWILLPVLPFIGLWAMTTGWVPQWNK